MGASLATRDALHRVARYVLIPFRWRVDEETSLVVTPGGFGTPLLADGSRARVEGASLVLERDGRRDQAALTTLGAAAAFLGVSPEARLEKPDIAGIGDLNAPLAVDETAAAAIAAWFESGWEALTQLGAEPSSDPVDGPHLWSHHFDVAIDILPDGRGRGSFGFSPGDHHIGEPYVYVVPWDPAAVPDDSGFWNATGFRGAVRTGSDLPTLDAALTFLRSGRDRLAGSS